MGIVSRVPEKSIGWHGTSLCFGHDRCLDTDRLQPKHRLRLLLLEKTSTVAIRFMYLYHGLVDMKGGTIRQRIAQQIVQRL
jgi:hypothetical protein